jgi:peptidoglycan/xylan/chitin deacetylase (PgdA/CDA1 family)
MPRSMRDTASNISSITGLSSILERLPKRNVLIVLNYHRIGDPQQTPYDPGTFSATAEEFDQQLTYLKKLFFLPTMDEALDMIEGRIPCRTSVLLTFDDGYLDNYVLAFPILRRHLISAVFFLPTAFIATNRLPWWDLIAYIVKNSRNDVIRLVYPEHVVYQLTTDNVSQVIIRVLQLYKRSDMTDREHFLDGLLKACGVDSIPPEVDRVFMNWDEAREMHQAGMAFGSHTHTHEILAKRSSAEQRNELRQSRMILERELQCNIDVLAYPVGKPHAFTQDTMDAARACNYRAAFSFYGGFNYPGSTERFNILRFGVERPSHARFRLQLALGSVTGKSWI